ncbi:amidohydrolase family protein [Natronococcus sp. A-GB7]|uniref:amidohydrolase family protein n=1 Tax=Natronococcus sp. A-GB7 TaxID=3037649 RepID=UPI00241C2262|nr:amidohydrolase family protein [Natronococcus sp. A-GB7]MDG5818645.1 amidohydrolase family protein [Natronococcus sp. A-GB7]
MARPSAPDDSSARRSDPVDPNAADPLRPGPTRRRYLAVTAGVGLSGAIAGCASVGSDDSRPEPETPPSNDERSDESEPVEQESKPTETEEEEEKSDDAEIDADAVDDLPLFDAHTHVIPTAARGHDPLSADELVAWMDDRGVDRAVVLPFDSPEGYPVQAPSWWVLEEVAAYPDRLVPFCSIDPRTLVYGDEIVAEVLEGYLERGARGFGELKVGMAIDDERLEGIYELCAEYGLPILFHTDRQSLTDDVGLPGLEGVLASYPEVDFVAHAHGWWAHVAADVESGDLGGLPEGSIDTRGRVWELLAAYDNIYGDLSTRAGWNALTRDPAVGQTFLETHHDRLVFGTDYLYPGQAVPQFELFERFDLELEAWADLRYRTLEGLLR